jgi:hypothetical protein
MSRRRRDEQPIGVGLTARQMKRKKPINQDIMRVIEPLTKNQEILFDLIIKIKILLHMDVLEQVKLSLLFIMLSEMF